VFPEGDPLKTTKVQPKPRKYLQGEWVDKFPAKRHLIALLQKLANSTRKKKTVKTRLAPWFESHPPRAIFVTGISRPGSESGAV